MIFRSKSERKIPSFFTPSHFVTAPVGQWGAFSPYPLRRYALRALFIPISHLIHPSTVSGCQPNGWKGHGATR